MPKIQSIVGREILDSRGNPTVEAEVTLDDGAFGRASVPSGASVGTHEAHELRDNDPTRYGGQGVLKAIENINDIIAHDLVGLPAENQRTVDERLIALDGTATKEHLGANAMLAISVANVKAMAKSVHMPIYRYLGGEAANLLPLPLMNVINGGKHASDSTDFQEFMIAPIGAQSFHEAIQMCLEVYHSLKTLLIEQGVATTVGDEGGFGLPRAHNKDALDLLVKAIEKADYRAGHDVSLAIDLASSSFFQDDRYNMEREGIVMNAGEMQQFCADIIKEYPIYSIEDPFAEDDWGSFATFTAAHGGEVQVIGDDLFVTNPLRLARGVQEKSANAILIKLNQIGTVTETMDVIAQAKSAHFATVISHRSGETVDSFIADFAVGTSSGQIKTGAPARSERTAKYNQLLRIEEQLGTAARFAGR